MLVRIFLGVLALMVLAGCMGTPDPNDLPPQAIRDICLEIYQQKEKRLGDPEDSVFVEVCVNNKKVDQTIPMFHWSQLLAQNFDNVDKGSIKDSASDALKNFLISKANTDNAIVKITCTKISGEWPKPSFSVSPGTLVGQKPTANPNSGYSNAEFTIETQSFPCTKGCRTFFDRGDRKNQCSETECGDGFCNDLLQEKQFCPQDCAVPTTVVPTNNNKSGSPSSPSSNQTKSAPVTFGPNPLSVNLPPYEECRLPNGKTGKTGAGAVGSIGMKYTWPDNSLAGHRSYFMDATQLLMFVLENIHQKNMVMENVPIMAISITPDFLLDFDHAQNISFFSTPKYYQTELQKIITENRLEFEPGEISEPGFYRIEITYPEDSENGIFLITLNKTAPPKVDSALYYFPIEGRIGKEKRPDEDSAGRVGYGIGLFPGNYEQITVNHSKENYSGYYELPVISALKYFEVEEKSELPRTGGYNPNQVMFALNDPLILSIDIANQIIVKGAAKASPYLVKIETRTPDQGIIRLSRQTNPDSYAEYETIKRDDSFSNWSLQQAKYLPENTAELKKIEDVKFFEYLSQSNTSYTYSGPVPLTITPTCKNLDWQGSSHALLVPPTQPSPNTLFYSTIFYNSWRYFMTPIRVSPQCETSVYDTELVDSSLTKYGTFSVRSLGEILDSVKKGFVCVDDDPANKKIAFYWNEDALNGTLPLCTDCQYLAEQRQLKIVDMGASTAYTVSTLFWVQTNGSVPVKEGDIKLYWVEEEEEILDPAVFTNSRFPNQISYPNRFETQINKSMGSHQYLIQIKDALGNEIRSPIQTVEINNNALMEFKDISGPKYSPLSSNSTVQLEFTVHYFKKNMALYPSNFEVIQLLEANKEKKLDATIDSSQHGLKIRPNSYDTRMIVQFTPEQKGLVRFVVQANEGEKKYRSPIQSIQISEISQVPPPAASSFDYAWYSAKKIQNPSLNDPISADNKIIAVFRINNLQKVEIDEPVISMNGQDLPLYPFLKNSKEIAYQADVPTGTPPGEYYYHVKYNWYGKAIWESGQPIKYTPAE